MTKFQLVLVSYIILHQIALFSMSIFLTNEVKQSYHIINNNLKSGVKELLEIYGLLCETVHKMDDYFSVHLLLIITFAFIVSSGTIFMFITVLEGNEETQIFHIMILLLWLMADGSEILTILYWNYITILEVFVLYT